VSHSFSAPDERAEPSAVAEEPTEAPHRRPRRRASDRGLLPMTVEAYLSLLDWSGRLLREGKPGAIPSELQPILDRLRVSASSWRGTMIHFGRRFRRDVGTTESLLGEAERLGVRRLHGIRASREAFAVPGG
jgi:hypothetical protein